MKDQNNVGKTALKIKLTQIAFTGIVALSGVTTQVVGGGSTTGGL